MVVDVWSDPARFAHVWGLVEDLVRSDEPVAGLDAVRGVEGRDVPSGSADLGSLVGSASSGIPRPCVDVCLSYSHEMEESIIIQTKFRRPLKASYPRQKKKPKNPPDTIPRTIKHKE